MANGGREQPNLPPFNLPPLSKAPGSGAAGRNCLLLLLLLTLVPMPSMRQVSTAMAVWSPVIIFTSTPLAYAASMVALVSTRGGSNTDSTPCKRTSEASNTHDQPMHTAVQPPLATWAP